MQYGGKCFNEQGVMIKNRKCTIKIVAAYLFLFTLLTLAVAAYSHAAEQITLEQAIDTALMNNPALKATDAQIQATDAVVLRSASGFLPKVTVSETLSRSDNPLMVLGTKLNQEIIAQEDFSPDAINHPDAMSNYNTRLAVMQPVFNGGKEYLGRKQAKLAHEASIQDRNRTRQETVFNVIKAYYSLLLAREYNKVAAQSLETSAGNMKLAEARFKAGTVLQSDLLRAKVQYAEVKEMLTRSENGVKLAMAGLNFAMGAPQQTEYTFEGTLETKATPEDMNGMLSEALALRPDLVSMGLNRKNAETNISQARADYIPTLNLMGQVDWNGNTFANDSARSWAVMAVLQWNLFDGLATTSRVREASATAGRMRAIEDQTSSAVQFQVRQAYYNLASSQDRIAATASTVQEAEEGLRIVQKRYEVGMTTLVDVLGAESALIRTKTNALQALFDNNIAHAELKLATGTL